MFEVTVIEKFPNVSSGSDFVRGATVMSHIPMSDEMFDQDVADLIANENACVENGILIAYTIITHYEQFNKVEHYVDPQTLVE